MASGMVVAFTTPSSTSFTQSAPPHVVAPNFLQQFPPSHAVRAFSRSPLPSSLPSVQSEAACPASRSQLIEWPIAQRRRNNSLTSASISPMRRTGRPLLHLHGGRRVSSSRAARFSKFNKGRIVRAEARSGGSKAEPPKVIISGAPASGKGTQCELIVENFRVSHISTGDLLRGEVAAESETGTIAKQYMDAGTLVPDEIVVAMVEKKLASSEGGWLLDGYPRTLEQAEALEDINVRPQLFVLLDVPDDALLERIVGRRLDPITGKIYHLEYSPPETEEIANRLTHRFDDTEGKAKVRLATYHANVEAVIDKYKDIVKRVNGNRPKKEVFADIAQLLAELQKSNKSSHEEENSGVKKSTSPQVLMSEEFANGSPGEVAKAVMQKPEGVNGSPTALEVLDPPAQKQRTEKWKGVPTKLNTTPHSREIREYFYEDVCTATKKAVEAGLHKLRVQIVIPELNPEMDVYRIGTLLEIVREIAFIFANDGKRVRVCVQGSMGEGIFSGMPLQLAGTRQMLERMDWGDYGAKGTFINIGAVGAKEATPEDDMFILMAPQNAVGNCIIDDLKAMVEAAGDRPVIIVNPRLADLPGSGGVMQVQGRDKRMEFVASFVTCYSFRLLYMSGTQYPILGALRMAYPAPYRIYKRIDTETKSKEEYVLLAETFEEKPTPSEIGDAIYGRPRRSQDSPPEGFWGFLTRILN